MTPEQEQEIRALIAKGNKIEAIKLYREAMGVGLKEAKDWVDKESGTPASNFAERRKPVDAAKKVSTGCTSVVLCLILLAIVVVYLCA